ncbi:MAG: hypothetical protein Q7N50_14435 [Armatimonadota bacterium]|nr:hypothetical protein [Armatimonadota bacterium]
MDKFEVNIGYWDILLLVAVSLQATALSYLHHPKWKALIWTFPVPFTLASLAVGKPIGTTNIMGISFLLIYTHSIRLMYQRLRAPITAAIAIAAVGYCAAGWALAGILPDTDAAFWTASIGIFALGLALYLMTPHRVEPGHRSPLPVWIKLPVIAGVILILVVIKKQLQGFMTFFPMVGVVAAYEARKSLWTMGRQVPVIIMTIVPLLATCRLTQDKFGLGGALFFGWIVFALVLIPFTKKMWSEAEEDDA